MNPATEKVEASYDWADDREVSRLLGTAAGAASTFARVPLGERARLLRRVAEGLRSRAEELAHLVTREMGKPVSEARAEVEKSAWVLEYYVDAAAGMLAPEPAETDAADSFVRFDPLGVVLAIMPWNFPLWQVFRCAAPALAAGNVVVLKHAENVTGTALAIDRCFADAGAPEGVFQVLVLSNDATERVIGAPEVRAVSLTGSVRAGKRVAAIAGEHLKKTVLELGGSDAFVVLADADLSLAVESAVKARTMNAGQSCIAAKRFLVEASVADAFTEALVARMDRLTVGDPEADGTDLGPLARRDLRDVLDRQVRASVASGARLCAGGAAVGGVGFFYPPTVLDGVRPGMAAFDEETFGPVAAVVTVRDADDAITLANANRYGLGASIWTRDVGRAQAIIPRLEAGSVFVNAIVKSDPRLPFGGVKDSGYGRELGRLGLREFVNAKTVWIA